MIKNKYKDDYTQFERLNGKGRVVDEICYTGMYYILPFDEKEKKKTNLVNIGYTMALVIFQAAAGMVNQDSSRTFWIVYPYLLLFLPLAYLCLGVISYFGDPLRMQRAQYETGLVRIRRSLTGAMTLAGVSAALDILYIVLHHGEIQLGRELLYLLCHGLFLSTAFLYGRYYKRTYGALFTEQSACETDSVEQ